MKARIGNLPPHCSRRYEEAIDGFEKVLELHPDLFHAQMHLGDAYCAIGDYESAESAFLSARAHDVEHSFYLQARLCAVHAALGRRGEANHIIEDLVAISRERYVNPTFIAVAYLGVGDQDEVFHWLAKEVTVELAFAAISPAFDPVRSDPRFQNVLDRLGDR